MLVKKAVHELKSGDESALSSNAISKVDDEIDEELNQKLVQSAQTFLQVIQCGICYGIVTIDKKPVQCSICRNVIFCYSCSLSMKGSCGYCKSPESKYIPVDANLLDLIRDLRF